MYKLLLCWRYLRTRYIALASIISVMLGVATMIVVNSVMAGFNREMQDRIHGILSDVVIESHGLNGFPDPEWHMNEIRRLAGDDIIGMTPTVIVPALLSFQVGGNTTSRQVNFIGIDEATHADVSDFSRFLQHPNNRSKLSFDLRENGYDVRDCQVTHGGAERPQMQWAGWAHRRQLAEQRRRYEESMRPDPNAPSQDSDTEPWEEDAAPADASAPAPESEKVATKDSASATDATAEAPKSQDPFASFPKRQSEEKIFDPATEQHTGLVMGIALASFRDNDGKDRFLILPGDDVTVTLPTAGQPPKGVSDTFTVVDFYESKMSEYDSGFVFLPLAKLQQMRGMIDPSTGIGSVTSIQIRLRPGADGNVVRDKIRQAFPPELYGVQTWRDKQGPLLGAVQMETAILNVLLFLIIAVAGFGILAIFFMIVVEKTRDIGILKSLGASGNGIMGIFLTYGLLLGLVGSGIGLVIGLLFVCYINEIAAMLGMLTGREVFDPAIYYFQRIPTLVDPLTISWIVIGAMLIAILASILPARRAARLHPVEALRYE